MSKYQYISIQPAHGGFGEYDAFAAGGECWASDSDLLAVCAGNFGEITELEDDADLPDGIEDIRGRIHNEPKAIYAYIDAEGDANYFGISAIISRKAK